MLSNFRSAGLVERLSLMHCLIHLVELLYRLQQETWIQLSYCQWRKVIMYSKEKKDHANSKRTVVQSVLAIQNSFVFILIEDFNAFKVQVIRKIVVKTKAFRDKEWIKGLLSLQYGWFIWGFSITAKVSSFQIFALLCMGLYSFHHFFGDLEVFKVQRGVRG